MGAGEGKQNPEPLPPTVSQPLAKQVQPEAKGAQPEAKQVAAEPERKVDVEVREELLAEVEPMPAKDLQHESSPRDDPVAERGQRPVVLSGNPEEQFQKLVEKVCEEANLERVASPTRT